MKKRTDLSKYRDLVQSIRIDHIAYSDILNELTGAYDAVGHSTAPVCMLITGESRTGKSSVVRDLLETYLPTQLDDRMIRSVVYAVAPAKASVKSLLESLLRGLGDPFWSRGSVGNMTERLYTLLDAVQCKMIILDEFQHLCDKGQKQSLHLLADWIKVLMEDRKYGLVAVGLPVAASIVHGHEQLSGRFDDELRMPLFDWNDRTSAGQFRAILRQFQKELHPFQLPLLDSREMAFRMFLASAGRIGLVAKLLERAVRNAIQAGNLDIGLNELQAAYRRAIWSSGRFPVGGGPFGASKAELSGEGVQEAVLANAALEDAADQSSEVTVYGKSIHEGSSKEGKLAEDSARVEDSTRIGAVRKRGGRQGPGHGSSARARANNQRQLRKAL
ncbi:MAG: TniB family NTP-binding protein [Lysobacteraceae bacterium]